MVRRREHGSGSLYQRKSDGLWVGTIEVPSGDGSRRRVTVSSRDKAEARRKLRDRQEQIRADGAAAEVSTRQTVKGWSEVWLPIVERELAPRSYANSASAVSRWIVPTIGHRRLEALTPADLRAVATAQRDAGRGLSTQRRTHSVLMTMLRAAVVEGYPVPLRLLQAKAPAKGTSDRTALASTDALSILAQAATLPHGSRWAAAFLEGLRQGEALGLTWDRVDLDRGVMTIDRQLQALPYRVKRDRSSGFRVPDGYEAVQVRNALHLVRPKSEAGYRVIPLVPWMSDALRAWRDAAPSNEHGLVWPTPEGGPTGSKIDDAEWYALQASAGVHHPTRMTKGENPQPAPFTVHEIRHTTATLLLECGVDPAIVIAIMGHSAILTTRGYQHARTAPMLAGLERVAERLQLVA